MIATKKRDACTAWYVGKNRRCLVVKVGHFVELRDFLIDVTSLITVHAKLTSFATQL